MKKYSVQWEARFRGNIEVESNSLEEAKEKAIDNYDVLDHNFYEVEIIDIEVIQHRFSSPSVGSSRLNMILSPLGD